MPKQWQSASSSNCQAIAVSKTFRLRGSRKSGGPRDSHCEGPLKVHSSFSSNQMQLHCLSLWQANIMPGLILNDLLRLDRYSSTNGDIVVTHICHNSTKNVIRFYLGIQEVNDRKCMAVWLCNEARQVCWCFKASATLGQLCTTFNTFRVWSLDKDDRWQFAVLYFCYVDIGSILNKFPSFGDTLVSTPRLQDVLYVWYSSRCCRLLPYLFYSCRKSAKSIEPQGLPRFSSPTLLPWILDMSNENIRVG